MTKFIVNNTLVGFSTSPAKIANNTVNFKSITFDRKETERVFSENHMLEILKPIEIDSENWKMKKAYITSIQYEKVDDDIMCAEDVNFMFEEITTKDDKNGIK